MLRPAFSTVACPTWTLENVAAFAARYAFQGVELRTFGYGGGPIACDPGLTGGEKIKSVFLDAGVDLAGVASGATLDEPIRPPVLGHLLPIDERVIENAKQFIDIAAAGGSEYVRFFLFRRAPRERKSTAVRRIADRLKYVCDHAQRHEVRVAIENGGDFPLAEDLYEFKLRVRSQSLVACYDLATAREAGENPVEAVGGIAPMIEALRLRDLRDGRPAPLGEGEEPLRETVEALARTGSTAWLVHSWDRLWIGDLGAPEEIVAPAARLLVEWATAPDEARTAAA